MKPHKTMMLTMIGTAALEHINEVSTAYEPMKAIVIDVIKSRRAKMPSTTSAEPPVQEHPKSRQVRRAEARQNNKKGLK